MNITDDLLLDISQPLRSFDQLDDALIGSARAAERLNTEMGQAGEEVQQAAFDAANFERRLSEAERAASRITTETQSMAFAAGRAEADFRNIADALQISEAEARDLSAEILDSQAAANRLEDAARDVARQLGLSGDEARRFETALRGAGREASDLDTRTAALPNRFLNLRTAAQAVGAAFAAIGVGQLFSLAGRGAQAAIGQFQALNESVNAVNVTFETGAAAVLRFGEKSAESAGLSAAAFQQAVVPIGAVLTNFGFSANEAGDAAIQLVQRAADLASVFNTDVSEALTAINSALVGQVEPLRRYGAEISVTRAEQFAFANGLASTRAELDQAVLTQARLGLILQDTRKVQGDFVNTSTELANAQRIAKAETQEFGATFGEVLAPAMEVVIGLVPPILDGLRQLVPAFGSAADSAAQFFDKIDQGGTGGLRAEFQGIAAGIGLTIEAFNAFGDLASFAFDTLTLESSKAGFQMDQFNERIARTTQRLGGQFLAKSLDEGVDSLTAFGNALAFVGREQENINVFADSFRGFAIAADLTQTELLGVTNFMIENAAAAGLSAAEVEFLNQQYAILRNTLFVVGNEVNQATAAMQGFNAPLATQGSRFVTFGGEVESGTTRAIAAMAKMAAETEAQLQRTETAFDLFADAPAAITESFTSAVEDLREQVVASASFEADIAKLFALDLGFLARDLQAKGPAAAEQVRQALANLPLATEANQLLAGIAGPAVEAMAQELKEELIDLGIDPTIAAEIAGTFDSPIVADAITQAGRSVAGIGVSEFRQGLIDELAALDAAALADAVEGALGASLDFSDTAYAAGVNTAKGYEQGIIDELEIQSPSKVMMRLGEQAGLGLLEGFMSVANRPIPILTGLVIGGAGGFAAGGASNVQNVNVQNTINHPVSDTLLSDVALLDEVTGAAAAGLRAFNS